MIIGDNLRLEIPPFGDIVTVKPFPANKTLLEKGVYYPIGEYLYKYIGRVDKFRDLKVGEIAYVSGSQDYFTNSYSDEDDVRDYYHISNIFDADNAPVVENDVDEILMGFHQAYVEGNNIMKGKRQRANNPDGTFMPELKATDDALTRTMKKMITHKKIIPSEYRVTMSKEYSFDNMRSALAGATVNMTISKFLAWCDLLDLDWEFRVFDNGTDLKNPLKNQIYISKYTDIECECGDPERGIFKVPINEDDDPLKKLIKCAIIEKHININDYKDRGPTPYLLNNMRSALKGKSKMMMPYFVSWCEILGCHFNLKIINPDDGVSFEANETYDANDYSINESE